VFLDSSAILAILLEEDEATLFLKKMKRARKLYFSPVVRFETIVRLASIKSGKGKPIKKEDFEQAEIIVEKFATMFKVSMLPIGDREAKNSTDAYMRYGKGTGDKAQLNMGDCFSYACANTNKISLLFKGNDFIHTDIEQA